LPNFLKGAKITTFVNLCLSLNLNIKIMFRVKSYKSYFQVKIKYEVDRLQLTCITKTCNN